MAIAAKILNLFLALFVLTCAVDLPFLELNSDPSPFALGMVLVLPVVAIAAGIAIITTFLCVRRGLFRKKSVVLSWTAILVLAAAANTITWRCLVPANLRFAFSYPGNTGTYHCVQFYFKEHGRWLEGPSVEGWPLTVRFPDLNGDGYPDIRVVPNAGEGAVEFIFLPKNDGRSFWQPAKNNSGLSAGYPPANYYLNYP